MKKFQIPVFIISAYLVVFAFLSLICPTLGAATAYASDEQLVAERVKVLRIEVNDFSEDGDVYKVVKAEAVPNTSIIRVIIIRIRDKNVFAALVGSGERFEKGDVVVPVKMKGNLHFGQDFGFVTLKKTEKK